MFSCTVIESIHSERTQRKIVFQGSATLDQSEAVQQVFCTAMLGCRHLIVDLRGLMEIDMSFLVNLCAAHRSTEILGVRFSVEGTLSDCFIHDEEYATHSRDRGCPFSGRSECRFWSRSKKPLEKRTSRPPVTNRTSHMIH